MHLVERSCHPIGILPLDTFGGERRVPFLGSSTPLITRFAPAPLSCCGANPRQVTGATHGALPLWERGKRACPFRCCTSFFLHPVLGFDRELHHFASESAALPFCCASLLSRATRKRDAVSVSFLLLNAFLRSDDGLKKESPICFLVSFFSPEDCSLFVG